MRRGFQHLGYRTLIIFFRRPIDLDLDALAGQRGEHKNDLAVVMANASPLVRQALYGRFERFRQ